MTKLLAVLQLWRSVVRAHFVHYTLGSDETTATPGITIRIRRGEWLHYYTIERLK